MAAKHKSASSTLLVTLLTLFLLTISVLAQENCKKSSVQETLRLWTNEVGDDNACPPETLIKLIEYYKDLRESKRSKGNCRQTMIIEARKLIADKVADVMQRAVTEPEKAKELAALVPQLGALDGLIDSAIDTAYWSLGLFNQQDKLAPVITKASDGEPKLRALLALERLAAANSETDAVEQIKTLINQVDEQRIVNYDDKTKSQLAAHKKQQECASPKSQLLTYPPTDLQEKIQTLSELQKKCKAPDQVARSLAELNKKSTDTWIRCYVKMTQRINTRANIVKSKVLLLDSALGEMRLNCGRPSGSKVTNNEKAATNFQAALNDISRFC